MITPVARLLLNVCILLMVTTACSAVAAGEYTSAQLIDIAGSQRMLTQRMLRDYALVGLQITYQDPAADRTKTVQKFSDQLQTLKTAFINDEILAALVSVETLWTPLKEKVMAQPDKDKALALLNELDQLRKASNNVVLLMQKASGKAKAKVVNIAGHQRMQSQRMAALYMLHFWGVENSDFFEQFKSTVEEFRKAQNYLLKVPSNTPEIRKRLSQAAKSFRWFEKAAYSRSNRLTPEVIMRNSDIILQVMNEATQLYAAI